MKRALLFLLLLILCSGSFAQYPRRMVAEWEPAYGTLVRWPLGIPAMLVVELAQDDSLYVLVENTSQQNQATAHFNSLGVNMDHCRFLFADTYSHWTRDWGPHYVFDEQGNAHIADPVFDGYPWVPGCNTTTLARGEHQRGYEEDDAVNIALAQQLGLPLISMPLYLTGGNIMTDGHGQAVSTRQMLDENTPICDEDCFFDTTADSMGLSGYTIVENPEIYGIQHIDCYAKFLDEETVLVKSVETWHPEYNCIEELASHLSILNNCYGRPYDVVRIACGSYNGSEVAAYTNSLILNGKVLVPTFGIETDVTAIETYEEAMPGYEVIGFYYDDWYYYDALHCRTMGIFDSEMLRIWHKPRKKVAADEPVEIISLIDDRSGSGLIGNSLKVYWREEGEFSWDQEMLSPAYGIDSFNVMLPSFPDGTVVEYYISAADSSDREEMLPRTAPFDYFSFESSSLVTGVDHPFAQDGLMMNVFCMDQDQNMVIHAKAPARTTYTIKIYNLQGVPVIDLGSLEGETRITWNGTGLTGKPASGLYLVVMNSKGLIISKKIFLNH